MTTKMCFFAGHLVHGLDVRFEDPTTGFFLRETASTTSPAQQTVAASTSSSSLGIEDVFPTTSIILGTNGMHGKQRPKNSLERTRPGSRDDILHTERYYNALNNCCTSYFFLVGSLLN
jgi:hypothetical protein